MSTVEDLDQQRMFPIQGGPAIPWSVIAPHERQAHYNHSQTLTRLAERGGLDASEAVAVLESRPWTHMTPAEARTTLLRIVAERQVNPRAESAEAALAEIDVAVSEVAPPEADDPKTLAQRVRDEMHDFRMVMDHCLRAHVRCDLMGRGCRAWQPRAAQTGQGE
jgi:hypothetical protein